LPGVTHGRNDGHGRNKFNIPLATELGHDRLRTIGKRNVGLLRHLVFPFMQVVDVMEARARRRMDFDAKIITSRMKGTNVLFDFWTGLLCTPG